LDVCPVPILASAHWIPDLLVSKFNDGGVGAANDICGLNAAVDDATATIADLARNARRDVNQDGTIEGPALYAITKPTEALRVQVLLVS
jgi:hypothetical protein